MRSRSAAAPLAALALLCAAASWAAGAFVAPAGSLRGSSGAALSAAAASTMLPAAAQAAGVEMDALDVGTSLNLAGLTEVLMCGIVMGTVPVTILGMLVAAWLQFKKGPTLGI